MDSPNAGRVLFDVGVVNLLLIAAVDFVANNCQNYVKTICLPKSFGPFACNY